MALYIAVAMIAAAQGDVVINIEETPITNTEVSNKALTKYGKLYFSLLLINLCSLFLPIVQLKEEKVRFSLFTDHLMIGTLKILLLLFYYYC